MKVNITDYGECSDDNYVVYEVSGLLKEQIEYLHSNLEDENSVEGDVLKITMHFTSELYPFGSDAAKFRRDDFIAREEIEMGAFLSSFLEDM